MKLLYICSSPSIREFAHIRTTVRPGMDMTPAGMCESGVRLHSLLQEGLCRQPNMDIYAVIGRFVSRRTNRGMVWKTVREQPLKNLRFKHIGFLNLPGCKQLGIGISYFFTTLAWLAKNHKEKEKYLLIDACYVTALPFVLSAAAFGRCKTAAICCDIYDYMGDVHGVNNAAPAGFIRRTVRKLMRHFYAKLDGFVLLTEQMNDVLNPAGKPYVVVEGLVDSDMARKPRPVESENAPPTILYAGALREIFGLKNLIEGFRAYRNPDARLLIYGGGDYAQEVAKAAKEDARICFGGIVPIEEVVRQEQAAQLLVNPRPTDLEFTRYSFPSKNMEYMASGTPVLTTRLPGMPLEYYQYIYTIDGNSAADITEALERVFALPEKERLKKGEDARIFVLKKKNNTIQAHRVLVLFREDII